MPMFPNPFGRLRDLIRRPGAAVAVSLAYTMLHDFEALGAATPSSAVTISLDTSSRKALHTAGMRIVGNSTNLAQSVSNIVTTTEDSTAWDVIVVAADLGSGYEQELSTLRPTFLSGGQTYAYRADTANGVSYNAPTDTCARGKRWFAFQADKFRVTDINGATIKNVGTASKAISLGINAFSPGNAATDFVVDAMVRPAFHKPAICLTFDDMNLSQYTNAFPAMQARGIPGTIYGGIGLVDQSAKLTSAQCREMLVAGWSMCVDSEGGDLPLNAFATRADAIAALNTNRDGLLTRFGDVAGSKHLCYSYGQQGYFEAPYSGSVTSNGTTTLTLPGTFSYSQICAGMRVFGPNVPAGTTVIKPLSQTTVQVSNAIPAGTNTLTFSARVRGLTATCNGTTTVVVSSTANLFAGMHLLASAATKDTRVLSIDSATQVTVDKPVPASVVKVNFGYVDGEWWPTKVYDDLIANGYLSGRRVTGFYGMYTGFGIDPLVSIGLYGYSIDTDASIAIQLANLTQLVNERQDVVTYRHDPQNMTAFNTLLDGLAALRDAGKCDLLTVPAWYAKASARGAIA